MFRVIMEWHFVWSTQQTGRHRLKSRLKRYWPQRLPEKLVGISSGRPIVMPIELAGIAQIRESPRSEWCPECHHPPQSIASSPQPRAIPPHGVRRNSRSGKITTQCPNRRCPHAAWNPKRPSGRASPPRLPTNGRMRRASWPESLPPRRSWPESFGLATFRP